MPQLIQLDAQKLAYVVTPKVASTSLMQFCYAVAGLDLAGENVRKSARKSAVQRQLADLGVQDLRLTPNELVARQAALDGYYWIAACRDPLKRLISSYHSKAHRYAQTFDKTAFRAASLRRVLDGPRALSDSRYLSLHVTRRIDFPTFVQGLVTHGITFDAHFRLQTKHLCHGRMQYDRIVRLESLEDDIQAICAAQGIKHPYPNGFPRLNVSDLVEKPKVEVSEKTIGAVEALYAEDFRAFGYPMPSAG